MSPITISTVLLRQVLGHAASMAGQEVCGLLFGDKRSIVNVEPCDNVTADPARSFELDPARLIDAYRRARQGGPEVVGHYHSHPTGSGLPSLRDARAARPDGTWWMIVADGSAFVWKAVANGAVHGRFDRCSLIVSPCAEAEASSQVGAEKGVT